MHLYLSLWCAMWRQVFGWARPGSPLSNPTLCQRGAPLCKGCDSDPLAEVAHLSLDQIELAEICDCRNCLIVEQGPQNCLRFLWPQWVVICIPGPQQGHCLRTRPTLLLCLPKRSLWIISRTCWVTDSVADKCCKPDSQKAQAMLKSGFWWLGFTAGVAYHFDVDIGLLGCLCLAVLGAFVGGLRQGISRGCRSCSNGCEGPGQWLHDPTCRDTLIRCQQIGEAQCITLL